MLNKNKTTSSVPNKYYNKARLKSSQENKVDRYETLQENENN